MTQLVYYRIGSILNLNNINFNNKTFDVSTVFFKKNMKKKIYIIIK